MTIWRPWRALRKQDHLLFNLTTLPPEVGGAVVAEQSGHVVILIDRSLGQVERKVALAHELVHLERGRVPTDPRQSDMWGVMAGREEAAVDRIVAERLVPVTTLRGWLTRRDEPATALDVAEEYEVTIAVAERALRAVADRAA